LQQNGKLKKIMLKEETLKQQSLLANYCRTGVEPVLLNAKQENLHHYRRLVFNIACDTLETAYPITYSFLSEKDWDELTYQFFSEHKCKTTQVWKMPLEFYEYCLEKNIASKLKMPFLNDLLYFEWLELEVHTMPDINYPQVKEIGSWLNDEIAINPEYKLVKFEYPVHTTAVTSDIESKKGNYFFLIYREKETGRVQFVDLSMLYVFVIENIVNGKLLINIINEANTLFNINDVEVLKKHILIFIEDLKQRQFIIGFKK